jgi:hypothetical protein
MQALLAKEWISKSVYKVCTFKLRFREILNYYFINYYFNILERIDFKPYFYYFMQASSPCYAHKDLLKIFSILKTSCLTGLKHSFEY